MSNLKQQFNDMVERVKSGDGIDFKPNNMQKLEIYALYKQATEGDVQGEEPGVANIVERAKYLAWQKLSGMSSEEAMQKYIDYFS